ncbi:hypothetical protein MVI01_37060 [Myxococcus virescens]|uniref:Uncharacterized protein n=1 Tax=Myxococcus virescens TaxID=83456 RepID=A0A511HEE4_9BACT|nr:hypothetical protein MVI01_37060 [Myxococcus virescens]
MNGAGRRLLTRFHTDVRCRHSNGFACDATRCRTGAHCRHPSGFVYCLRPNCGVGGKDRLNDDRGIRAVWRFGRHLRVHRRRTFGRDRGRRHDVGSRDGNGFDVEHHVRVRGQRLLGSPTRVDSRRHVLLSRHLSRDANPLRHRAALVGGLSSFSREGSRRDAVPTMNRG